MRRLIRRAITGRVATTEGILDYPIEVSAPLRYAPVLGSEVCGRKPACDSEDELTRSFVSLKFDTLEPIPTGGVDGDMAPPRYFRALSRSSIEH